MEVFEELGRHRVSDVWIRSIGDDPGIGTEDEVYNFRMGNQSLNADEADEGKACSFLSDPFANGLGRGVACNGKLSISSNPLKFLREMDGTKNTCAF